MKLDWGDGAYEETGRSLLAAAESVIERAEIAAGERVIDVGCGTGNAALAAARRGAEVTAVDPATRLVEVTRQRARDEGLSIDALVGEAASLGVPDRSFDAALAVFSIIFAPHPQEAVAGVLRAVRPGGRIVMTTWVPAGPIHESSNILVEGMGVELSSPWGDESSARALFESHGATVAVSEEAIVFEADSAEAWFESLEGEHPFWRLARAWFADNRPDAYADVRARCIAALREGSEAPDRLVTTSRYRILRVEVA